MKTITANGYTFTISDNGTIEARGEIRNDPASRSGMKGITPDGYDSSTKDKGHIIAARHGGVAEEFNVVSQDRHLNRSEYKSVENAESRLVENGCKVETEKIAYSNAPGQEPIGFLINDTITLPDGSQQTIHDSVMNFSIEEQEQWEIEALKFENEEDDKYFEAMNPVFEEMSYEEYQQDYDDEEDEYDLSIADEYDVNKWSQTFYSTPSAEEEETGTLSESENTEEAANTSEENAEEAGVGSPVGAEVEV